MPRFGRFGGRRGSPSATGAPTSDYGSPARRSNPALRPAILANHWLHWISSIIVLGISAYFIAHYNHNTHLVYWVTIAAIDALIYLPALFLPALGSYKGYLAPAAWIFSYLWLTAFIFSAQDYNFNAFGCPRSPSGVNKCGLKKTLEAFAFLAFFTNIIGQILEGWLWAKQPFKNRRRNAGVEKHGVGSTSTGATTVPPTTGTTAV
ncbi:hypothetical protein G647_06172 [Cladophialophora carrionii CBS 160.54]|uniref:MARVEL domain-containing protein n=1 Tax=Cladophialophora carrionii CBS 160.54 TaxID=1279043 RepID=V9D614_9EURO|nr:uncharacterized protein G647_06172 [Cladophialophora carrionii CBS 160.54]ETI22101.1 hypothetical protein G647_06172 [Cladophialophora carrionii CBS 160.54]